MHAPCSSSPRCPSMTSRLMGWILRSFKLNPRLLKQERSTKYWEENPTYSFRSSKNLLPQKVQDLAASSPFPDDSLYSLPSMISLLCPERSILRKKEKDCNALL